MSENKIYGFSYQVIASDIKLVMEAYDEQDLKRKLDGQATQMAQ